jgi:hypothetical protein
MPRKIHLFHFLSAMLPVCELPMVAGVRMEFKEFTDASAHAHPAHPESIVGETRTRVSGIPYQVENER